MVETLEEAKREAKKDLPQNWYNCNISYAYQWGTLFGYPLEKIKVGDYYVKVPSIVSGHTYYLIEGCKSHLKRNLLQLEESAIFFKNKSVPIDVYLIIINELTKTDKKAFKLESYNKPLRRIFGRDSFDSCHEYKICKKPVFVLFRKEKDELK